MGIVDDLDRAREAYERREWVAAYRALSDLDDADLRADDYTALATTAYLLGRRNDCIQAFQRAFQTNIDAGDRRGAAKAALWLALVLGLGGEPAVAGGWAARAERLLDGLGEVPEWGFAMIHHAYQEIFAGELAAALRTADRISRYGERFRDPDLLTQGLTMQGRLMAHVGDVREGLRVMDEAMVGVLTGDVSPIISGIAYCTLIEACVMVGDVGRMAEWTRALTRWCDAQPGLVAFTGQCAVHRGQMFRLRGAYDRALDELELAIRRYELIGGAQAVGLAHQERGDVFRLLGDLERAEQAYDAATRYGCDSQPGRAALCLDRGDAPSAATALRTLLAEVADPLERNRLLPVAVESALAVGRIEEAAAMTDEQAALAESFGCTSSRAAAAASSARLLLARGDPETAGRRARTAIELWNELSIPYEVGRCRTLLGRALAKLGDPTTAEAELAMARSIFAELGARQAERDVAELLAETPVPGDLSPRELDVLQLVAAGKTNSEIAGELFVADKTVARHLSNIFTKLGVTSRTAAAAFAFEHRLVRPAGPQGDRPHPRT